MASFMAKRKRGYGVMRPGLPSREGWRVVRVGTTAKDLPNVGAEWSTRLPPGSRFKKGGDLYRHPMTRAEMLAPLAWHEEQMATVYRYGELADGTLGFRRVK